jgi:superfamily II DNA or RNA helicase
MRCCAIEWRECLIIASAIDLIRGRVLPDAGSAMTLRFTKGDVLGQLGAAEFRKGTFVLNEDCVLHVEVSTDGTRIRGRVDGTAPRPYSQTITLEAHGKPVTINGHCTCPIGFNCKHAAAVLLYCLKNVESDSEVSSAAAVPSETNGAFDVAGSDPRVAAAGTGKPRSRLSHEVSGWLERLAVAAAPDCSEVSSHSSPRRLLYVLNHEDALVAGNPPYAVITPVSVRLRKDGSVTDEKPYDPDNVARPKEQRARFLTEIDHALLRDLAWLKRESASFSESDVALGTDATGGLILQALINSGRLRYGGPHGPVLRAGPAVPAEPRWIKADGDEQKLSFVPVNGASGFDYVLPLRPPHYVDLVAGHIGVIDTILSPQVALEVARAPAVAGSEAAIVKDMMRQRLGPKPAHRVSAPSDPPAAVGPPPLPLPEAPDTVETRFVAPSPRLALFMAKARLKRNYQWYATGARHSEPVALPLGRLSFDYAGEIVPHGANPQMLERVEGDKLILTPRDMQAEAKAAQRLGKLGMVAVADTPHDMSSRHAHDFCIVSVRGVRDATANLEGPNRFVEFSLDAVPQLVKEGWLVTFSNDYPYRVAEGDARWWADVGEGSGIDWFSFELGIEFEGHRIELVPHLAGMLAKLPPALLELAFSDGSDGQFVELCGRRKSFHRLSDGRLLPLPGERLAPMLKALLGLIGPRHQRIVDGKVRLHRAEAGALAAFAGEAGADVAWAANAKRLIELGSSLRSGRGLKPVAVSASFRGQLRPYQGDGLAWLDFLREAGFGGVLADDMGLGKTVQALAFLAREKDQGRLDRPALIVCPTSVLPNWQSEAAQFAPQLSVLPLRGLDRRESFAAIPKSDLVLTTYPLLARDHEVLLAQEFHAAILDEAQAIKNPKSAVSRLAHGIKARHRLALTGTPLENNLGEVWSLFEFLAPGLLGDETTFRRTFRIPIENHGDVHAQAFLSGRLKPFMLRRTKEEVAKELPPKTEIIERVRLDGAQRDLYETVRALMHAKVRDEIASKGLAKSHIIFLDALLKLRQICCDPRLLRLPQAKGVKGSAKLDRLMEMIPELVDEGRRILLFSQFTSMLALIEPELAKLNIPYVTLTGDTKDRATPVREFQAGKVPLFLVSLKAGGTGLNLTAADTVIHYDPWWNPAVENQATDRAHRIGQDKPVFVYKLIVDEGIETAIELLKARKAALAEALFAGGAKTPLDLTESDISALFAPLDRGPERRAA